MNKENIEIINTKPKQRVFTCGDIHGAHKALVQVLERSGFDYENDMLITLGDIVDGWGDSFMCVEELLKIKNRIDIVGNHDDWFDDFCQIGIHPDGWGQGGLNTAMSYAKGIGIELKFVKKYPRSLRSNKITYTLNLNSGDIPETHKEFFNKQIRFYKDDDNNVFVHGGFMRSLPLKDSSKDFMMWDRKLWDGALSASKTKTKLYIEEEVKNIFIGHTTTMIWDKDIPMKADVVWNLDTGAGGSGKLTIMDIDTHEYWQSDLIPELYPNDIHNNRK